MHLRYAVEIAKTKSINKAAENLFMSQPNLSRAIKDLEASLGIVIFNRTTKGMTLTSQGEEFLEYARKILAEIDTIENMYLTENINKQRFSVSVPRSSYISNAFSEFVKNLDLNKKAEVFYKETNAFRTIRNVLQSDYNLGIIRYQEVFDDYFQSLLKEKDLKGELVSEFTYKVVMSKNHPLANKDDLTLKDLEPFIEIAHADPYVPSLSASEVRKEELPTNVHRRIYVFERASQFCLLENVPTTYLWGTPVPEYLKEKYNIVFKEVKENKKVYKDLLIFRNDYKLSELDYQFITELTKSKRNILYKLS
jgi:DNA-binding transcriptional LysR family regulator